MDQSRLAGADRSRTERAVLWLAPALVCAMGASLMLGLHVYSPGEVWGAFAAFDGADAHHVVRDLRLPRAVIAPLVGAALGVAGVLLQTLARNRIASPDLLGLNGGAALAVVVANVWLGVDALVGLSAAAAVGALATALLVYGIAVAGGAMSPARTVLAGFTLAGLMHSFVQIVLTTDEATLDELLFWLTGAFVGRSLDLVGASLWLFVIGIVAAAVVARPLDALVTDDDTARGVGIPIVYVRSLAFVAIAALTGGAVAIAGPVAFIGLVVPHAARRLVGLGHRGQIVAAAFLGALFALVADVAARFLVYPGEAPVGAVTALIGGPLLVLLLRRRVA